MATTWPVSVEPAAQGADDPRIAPTGDRRTARVPAVRRSGAALERAFPDEPVWYLETLGIHPSYQRRGVGTALLAAGLAVVDADHVACHLHTSDEADVEYYKRWGFELTQPGFRAGPNGPTYYGMTRPHT